MDFALNESFNTRVRPILVGYEECAPKHSFGPFVRSCYLLHYVLDGQGVFKNENTEYTLASGSYFLIRPGEIATYQADENSPWKYVWIHFISEDGERLLSAPDTGEISHQLFDELKLHVLSAFRDMTGGREEYVCSVLYRALSEMHLYSSVGPGYVERAKAYITASYSENITVKKIAEALSLDRRYLWRIFKSETGISIKEFITRKRLEVAAGLLLGGRGVGESALLSGYSDVSNFSKAFKKRYGTWLGEYAKSYRNP